MLLRPVLRFEPGPILRLFAKQTSTASLCHSNFHPHDANAIEGFVLGHWSCNMYTYVPRSCLADKELIVSAHGAEIANLLTLYKTDSAQ